MLNFWIFLPLKELLVATFGETCALTSKKCVFEQGISIPNVLEKIQFFGRTPPFLLKKNCLKI